MPWLPQPFVVVWLIFAAVVYPEVLKRPLFGAVCTIKNSPLEMVVEVSELNIINMSFMFFGTVNVNEAVLLADCLKMTLLMLFDVIIIVNSLVLLKQ